MFTRQLKINVYHLSAFTFFSQPFVFCNIFPFILHAIFVQLNRISAAFIALTSIIIVDLIGLRCLTSAFGLICIFRGVSGILGPPVAGIAAPFAGMSLWHWRFDGNPQLSHIWTELTHSLELVYVGWCW